MTPDLALLQRRLNSCESTSALLARASDQAREFCDFERAVVLGVEHTVLVAAGVDAIEHPASDALRRSVLGDPIALPPDAPESELVRGRRVDFSDGVVGARLGLTEWTLGVVAPEGRALALVVVDRDAPAVGPEDQERVDLFGHLLGCALERVVLRQRMREMASELRHLTTSAHALMTEAVEAPVTMPTDFGHGPVFTAAGEYGGLSAGELDALLSPREREIAGLMVSGRSNREIGDELHLSPDTVKVHVARLVRKLGATNRVDAVARYVIMRQR